MRRSRAALAAMALLAMTPVARADVRRDNAIAPVAPVAPAVAPVGLPQAGVRVGAHPGFGRVVVDLPPGASASAQAVPGGVRVLLLGAVWPVQLPLPPVPWRGAELSDGSLLLRLRPGAVARPRRVDGRLIIDAANAPAPPPPPPTSATPMPAPAVPVAGVSRAIPVVSAPVANPTIAVPVAVSLPALAPPALAPPAPAPPAPAPPASAPPASAPPASASPVAASSVAALSVATPPVATPPVATRLFASSPVASPAASVREAAQPSSTQPAARFVAASPDVAAAVFTRAGAGYVVFDAVVTPDLSGLPGARLIPLEGAVAVTAPLPFGVRAVAGGWLLGASGAIAATSFTTGADGRLLASLSGAATAGRVVTMADPEGDGLLLIGTLRPGPLPEVAVAATPVAQATPDVDVVPTARGVVVASVSDAVTLRASRAGWVLATEGEGRVAAVDNAVPPDRLAAAVAAVGLKRCLDLPDLPTTALLRRLQVSQDAAAVAPAGDRAGPRLNVAAAMLSLGLGVEAAGQVSLALADDPRLRTTPAAQLLGLAASVLAHRAAIETPAADAACGPEAALWRHAGPPVASAAALAADLDLLRAYPAPLRHRLLPSLAETLATAEPAAAALRGLLAADLDGDLDFARAIAEPDRAKALAELDAVAMGRDAALHVRAARLAIERRLASGGLDARHAADAMEPLVVAWRGDASELDLRLRMAALRAQAGAWRPALATLREAAALADAGLGADGAVARVTDRARATFADALAADAKAPLSPLDLVTLVEENAALLPVDAAAVALAERLADRLASLDLPDRATKALATLAHAAPAGPPRATLGERLGRLRLAAGDPRGALAALADSQPGADSNATGLPATLEARRWLLWAQATAANGNPDAALLALGERDDDPALALRADVLERGARWPEATRVLAAVAARAMPASGPLNASATAAVLRWASAAARASDEATLQGLRETVLARVPTGASADLLRVLTAAPVREIADLPRAAREAALARQAMPR